MKRFAARVKTLWRDVLRFSSIIAFIVSAVVFLVMFFVTGMAFCFVIFFLASADCLLAQDKKEERSIFYGLRSSVRDLVVESKHDWRN